MPTARRSLAALLVLATSAVAGPTTAPSTLPADAPPRQVAEAFNEAVIAGDKDAALALVHQPDDKATTTVERLIKNAASGKSVPHAEGEGIDDDLAVVRLRVERAGEAARTSFVPMLHTDAGWRILTTKLPPDQQKRLTALRKLVVPADAPTTTPATPTP